jgi:GT2 family glycosyltransferase
VVLAYHPGELLGRTLDALSSSTVRPDQVLVVDNAAGDEQLAALVDARAGVETVLAEDNRGYGYGMNLGASIRTPNARREFILFLTHECLVESEAIREMLSLARSDPSIGAVGPLLARSDKVKEIWSAGGELKSPLKGPVHRMGGQSLMPRLEAHCLAADWLDGAALMVREAAFRAIGGFSEDYFLYWEDVDLCQRLVDAGWTTVVAPRALAWQEPGMMSPYLDGRNSLRYYYGRKAWLAAGLALTRQVLLSIRSLLGRDQSSAGRLHLVAARWRGVWDSLSGALDERRALIR